jgi:hypothetical protein
MKNVLEQEEVTWYPQASRMSWQKCSLTTTDPRFKGGYKLAEHFVEKWPSNTVAAISPNKLYLITKLELMSVAWITLGIANFRL